jgi:hypothetical protein
MESGWNWLRCLMAAFDDTGVEISDSAATVLITIFIVFSF